MTSKAYKAACRYILGLLDAKAEFSVALNSVIAYCQKQFPHENFEVFRNERLINEEIEYLYKWFGAIIEESPPPEEIAILWFYIVTENVAGEYSMDFCFAGDRKQEPKRFGDGLLESPEYLPNNHLAHSSLLESWADAFENLPFESSFFVEYMLGMTYGSFLARDLAIRFADKLTAASPRIVKAGSAGLVKVGQSKTVYSLAALNRR